MYVRGNTDRRPGPEETCIGIAVYNESIIHFISAEYIKCIKAQGSDWIDKLVGAPGSAVFRFFYF